MMRKMLMTGVALSCLVVLLSRWVCVLYIYSFKPHMNLFFSSYTHHLCRIRTGILHPIPQEQTVETSHARGLDSRRQGIHESARPDIVYRFGL